MPGAPFRLPPGLPVGAMKTYSLRRPAASHTRPATCAEVDCPHWRDGWSTLINPALKIEQPNGPTVTGAAQAEYIRSKVHGRRFVERRTEAGWFVFDFYAGQPCFAADGHTVAVDRPPLYLVSNGDWRGMTLARRHTRPDDWVEDFAGHQQHVTQRLQKG